MNTRDTEILAILKGYLEEEPNWKTHPMSIWNRARRMIVEMETGEKISTARSFNKDTGEWEL